jgi:hypothetical protein
MVAESPGRQWQLGEPTGTSERVFAIPRIRHRVSVSSGLHDATPSDVIAWFVNSFNRYVDKGCSTTFAEIFRHLPEIESRWSRRGESQEFPEPQEEDLGDIDEKEHSL